MSVSRRQQIQEIFELIGGLVRSLKGGHGRLFKQYGLGRSQVFMLFMIAHHKQGIAVKDLAADCHITSGAVSQLVDGLVKQDLVDRFKGSEDRRIILVKLSAKAHREFKKFKTAQFGEIAHMFDQFSGGEIKTFIRLLHKLNLTPNKSRLVGN